MLWFLSAAALAGDVVLVLPWASEPWDAAQVEKAAGRVLESPAVLPGDTLGDSRDLVDHLFTHANDGTPIPAGLATALEAEQASRPADTLYVGVPFAAREKDLWLWRWDVAERKLVRLTRR